MAEQANTTNQDGKIPEQQGQPVQTDKTENIQIPYSRFKEVNDHAKELETKLKQFETEKIAETQRKEEEALKAKGQYEELAKKKQLETEKAVNAARQRIANAYLTEIGLKHGIVDTDALSLFEGKIEFDENFNITNAEKIAESFEKEFKAKKSYLFNKQNSQPSPKPAIPKTDNSPVGTPREDIIVPRNYQDRLAQAIASDPRMRPTGK